MDNDFIFPACENIENKEDEKTWFWTEALECAKESGCKPGTMEFWVVYKLRVYETHGRYKVSVASIDTLAEDLGCSSEKIKNTLSNLCVKGRLVHIWCDKKVYRNKTKIFVTKRWCKEHNVDIEQVKVLPHGKNNEQIFNEKTTSGNVETTSGNVETTFINVETTSGNVVYPYMNKYNNKYKRMSINNNKEKRFVKPTIEEIQARCDEMGYDIDAESFFNYYESKGWVVGKTPMKNWRAALAGWNARNNKKSQVKHTTNSLVGFELWEEIMGAPMALTRENVSASEKLVQENGKDGLRNIILLARECKKDSRADYRASHIANLNDLLRNWEYLVDWARQKGIGGKSEVEEELENFNNTY